jgi:hypothetical protein
MAIARAEHLGLASDRCRNDGIVIGIGGHDRGCRGCRRTHDQRGGLK